ncbi:MAG: hypothetical protein AAFW98_10130, partial [Pseudomonadota bacterium]
MSSKPVTFMSASPPALTAFAPGRADTKVSATLHFPAKTDGPVAAALICDALPRSCPNEAARTAHLLARHGMAALVVDSFAARGFGLSMHPIRLLRVTEAMMLADAFAALTWLGARPDI